MPRSARIKNETSIFHIMVRSNSDVPLFRNYEDKEKYLFLIKKYQRTYLFKVYAYCLMTTHAHIEIDCCGADISKIMKSVNQCYAYYFNKKYDRHGHVFQDRFKSKLVTDDRYLILLSAYIHNNPKDIEEFKNNIENYKYSSLGIYLGIANDDFEILDCNYILQYFSKNKNVARKSYSALINKLSDSDKDVDIEFKSEKSETRSERKILIRNFKPDNIIKFLSRYTSRAFDLHIKFNHKNSEMRSLCVLLMRSLCNLSLKEICEIIGNISISGLWRLSEKGYNLIIKEAKYANLVKDLIEEYSVI